VANLGFLKGRASGLLPSASEMTCIVSSGALNSTHSLTPSFASPLLTSHPFPLEVGLLISSLEF